MTIWIQVYKDNFGIVGVGETVIRHFRVANAQGEGVLNVSNINSSNIRFTVNKTAFSLLGSTPNISEPTYYFCASLPYTNKEEEIVTVSFTPTGFGPQQTNITVTSDSLSGSSEIISYEGFGAYVWLNPFGGSFPDTGVGAQRSIQVTITNVMSSPVTIENITSSNVEFSVSGGIGQTLNPDESTIFNLAFTPTSLGQETTDVRIFTDVSDNTVVTFAANGVLAQVPALPLPALFIMMLGITYFAVRRFR